MGVSVHRVKQSLVFMYWNGYLLLVFNLCIFFHNQKKISLVFLPTLSTVNVASCLLGSAQQNTVKVRAGILRWDVVYYRLQGRLLYCTEFMVGVLIFWIVSVWLSVSFVSWAILLVRRVLLAREAFLVWVSSVCAGCVLLALEVSLAPGVPF